MLYKCINCVNDDVILREVGSPEAVSQTGGSGRANVQGQWHSIVFQYRRHSLVQYHQILIYSSHFRIGTVSNRTLWYPLVFAIVPRQDGDRTCCFKLLLGFEPTNFVLWLFGSSAQVDQLIWGYWITALEADTIPCHFMLSCIVMYYIVLSPLVSRPNK